MTGFDSLFDEPSQIDLRLDTARRDVADCLAALTNFVRQRLRCERLRDVGDA
jgi:adenylylsulfate kinase-like enzyme